MRQDTCYFCDKKLPNHEDECPWRIARDLGVVRDPEPKQQPEEMELVRDRVE